MASKEKVSKDLEKDKAEKLEIEDILAEPEEEKSEALDLEKAVLEDDGAEEVDPSMSEEKSAGDKEQAKVAQAAKEDKKVDPVKNKKSIWGTIAIIFFTILVTAAAVLGALWWFYQRNQGQATEAPKPENKVETPAADTASAQNIVYVNANEGLKLRAAASATSAQLAVIPYGTSLTVTETSGDWVKVSFQGQVGWVNSTYTSKTKPFDADWKTYSGSGFDPAAPKFSIKYPSDWAIDDYKIQKVDLGKTYKISFGEGGHGFTEDETITSTQENVTYSGNAGKKTILKRSGEIAFVGVQFEKNATYTTQIEFWVPEGYNPAYLTLFEQILSTIKFQ